MARYRIPILLSFLLVAPPSMAASIAVTITSTTRYQTVEGFGTCVDGGAAPYNQAWLQDLYAKDMGGSFLRVVVDPSLAPNPTTFTSSLSSNIALLNFNAPFIANEAVFAQALSLRAIDSFRLYATPWSPPAYMKANDDTTDAGNGSSTTNHLIDTAANYQQYAWYLAAFCAGFQQAYGMPIYGVSIQNELMFNETYNSCQYTDQEFHDVVQVVGATFAAQGITTKVMGPESVGPDGGYFTTNQVGFINAVEGDSAVAPYLNLFNIHSYSSNGVDPSAPQRSWLSGYWSQIQGYNKESWMTETSGDVASWLDTNTAGNQDGALFMGYRMNEDLAFGNDSTWFYWQITSGGDSADNFSLTGQNPNSLVPPAQQPKYAAYKQYSRFIRPGAVRVDASPDTITCNVTAWVHDVNKTLTVVMVNEDTLPATVTLALPSSPNVASFAAYRSSNTESFVHLADVPVSSQSASVTLPPQSILTLNGYDVSVASTPTPIPTDTPSPDCPRLFNGFESLTENGAWSGSNATRTQSTLYTTQGTYGMYVTVTTVGAGSPSWNDQVAVLTGFTPTAWAGYNSLTLDVYVDPSRPPWNGGWNNVYLYGNAPGKAYREISISPYGLQTGWNRVTFPLNWNLDTTTPAIGPTDNLSSVFLVLQTSVPQTGDFYMDNMVLHTGTACAATPTGSATPTPTRASTATLTFTATPTSTASSTPTSSFTMTASATASRTPTDSFTPTGTPSLTASGTPTPTSTATNSPTGTITPQPTSTATATFTSTPSGTPTSTVTATGTPTSTRTPTASTTATPTGTASFTRTPTASPTNSVTPPPTFTSTATAGPSTSPSLFPNPATGPSATLVLRLNQPADQVVVKIYTTAFRKVSQQGFGAVPAGAFSLPLQLKGPDGEPLANGLYYVVAEAPSGRWVLRLLVLR